MDAVSKDLFNPSSLIGLAVLGVIFLLAATVVVVLIRKSARQIENHLTDVTALRFVSAFAQVLTCRWQGVHNETENH